MNDAEAIILLIIFEDQDQISSKAYIFTSHWSKYKQVNAMAIAKLMRVLHYD